MARVIEPLHKQIARRVKGNKEANQQSYREKLSFAASINIVNKMEAELQALLKPVEVIENGVMITVPPPRIEPTHLASRKLILESVWKKIDKLVSNAPTITAKDYLDWQNEHLIKGDEIAPAMTAIALRAHLRHMLDTSEGGGDTTPAPVEELPSFLK